MVERQLPKLVTRVRFPSLAPYEDNKKDIVRENPGLFKGFIRMFFRFRILRYGIVGAIPHFLSKE